uniref:Uncharacterized protein n=1 Tax=Ralstonia solanacearum TaxID=305 RepID=A0A0S4TYZ3_RALSL|nr:protein of unknown function [Ralstonia solanacearum]
MAERVFYGVMLAGRRIGRPAMLASVPIRGNHWR